MELKAVYLVINITGRLPPQKISDILSQQLLRCTSEDDTIKTIHTTSSYLSIVHSSFSVCSILTHVGLHVDAVVGFWTCD